MSAVSATEFRDLHPVSPSQVETFRLCERKWAFAKLDRIELPPNKYAQRGGDTHAVLEKWQKDGTRIDFDTDIGKIVAPGLRFLPVPGSHLVESWFKFRTSVATYHGIKDLRSRPSPVRVIWDHKTTTNLKWMKTPEKLRRDPQANIYAVSEIEDAKDNGEHVERVEQNWVYYLTDPEKPRARKVQLHVLPDRSSRVPPRPKDVLADHFGVMYFDELYERFAEIEQTASKILNYRRLHESGQIRGGADVPYDVEGCDAFGGCPYRGTACVLTVSERIIGMEAKQSLAEKMQQALKGQASGSTSSVKPSEGAKAAAAVIKEGAAAPPPADARQTSLLPEINPPEHSKGVDPDSPAVKAAVVVDAGDRMGIVAAMAASIVSARVYSLDDGRAPGKIAKLAVEIGDAVIAELSKPRK